jgi:hypothetical protein
VIGLPPHCLCTCRPFHFVWRLHFDLLSEGDPSSSYSTAAHWARPRQTPVKIIFQIMVKIFLTVWHRSFTFNSNKSPTWCNSFSVYYHDVCLQLNRFRAFFRPSSGAQWLQWQPLVLPSYRVDSRAVFVVGPADRTDFQWISQHRFSWFNYSFKKMLRWFRRFSLVIACFLGTFPI